MDVLLLVMTKVALVRNNLPWMFTLPPLTRNSPFFRVMNLLEPTEIDGTQ